jgi:hypothetical protein
MSMIIGPESSGSAMARDSSIAILQMPLLPIARNSRASMRSRCRRCGPKYGFVPIQTDTSKTVPLWLELPAWLPRQLGYQPRFHRTRAKRDRERVYSLPLLFTSSQHVAKFTPPWLCSTA